MQLPLMQMVWTLTINCMIAIALFVACNIMAISEKIRNNAEVHGIAWAARHAAKNGVNISVVRFVLFGRY